MPITVKQLAERLDTMAKQGKGDMPVKIVQLDSNIALPFERGDIMKWNGEQMLMLVPEAPFTIKSLKH